MMGHHATSHLGVVTGNGIGHLGVSVEIPEPLMWISPDTTRTSHANFVGTENGSTGYIACRDAHAEHRGHKTLWTLYQSIYGSPTGTSFAERSRAKGAKATAGTMGWSGGKGPMAPEEAAGQRLGVQMQAKPQPPGVDQAADHVELPPEVWQIYRDLTNHILGKFAPVDEFREMATSYLRKFKPKVDPAAQAQKDLRGAQATVRQLGNRRRLVQQQLDKLRAHQQELHQKLEELDDEIATAAKVQQEATKAYSTHVLRSKLLDPAVPQLQELSANDMELLGDIPKLEALLTEVGSSLSEDQRQRFAALLEDSEFTNLCAKRRKQGNGVQDSKLWEDAGVDDELSQADGGGNFQPTPGV